MRLTVGKCKNDAETAQILFLDFEFHKIQQTTQIGLRGDRSAEFGRDVLGE